jgi:H/ACA ribonucleoprotein complex subunit 2
MPQKRPVPKDGATAKPAPTAEEVAEWKEGLEECMQEVAKLETPGGVNY